MYSLRILTLVMCAGLALGADAGSSVGVGVVDPWDLVPSLLTCASSESPSACVQNRAFRALEDLADQEDEQLPKGVSPAVARVIDRIGDLIASGLSQWYPAEAEAEAGPEEGKAISDNDVEQARGHHKKKKVHKAVKKAVIKLLILLYVKAQAARLFLYGVQTFVMFKMMIFAGIYVLAYAAKAFVLIKQVHHEKAAPKVLYIEPQIKHVTQHHAHVSPDVHHEEYAPEGVEYEVGADHEPLGLWRRRSASDAHRLAYFKQLPPAERYKTV